jgi:hypothetical protein
MAVRAAGRVLSQALDGCFGVVKRFLGQFLRVFFVGFTQWRKARRISEKDIAHCSMEIQRLFQAEASRLLCLQHNCFVAIHKR